MAQGENRMAERFFLLALLLASSCKTELKKGHCRYNNDCDAGEVCVSERCHRLCLVQGDCAEALVCFDHLCIEPRPGLAPEITAVAGNAPGDPSRAADGFLVTGVLLADAAFELRGDGWAAPLETRRRSEQQVEVFWPAESRGALPAGAHDAKYQLIATNGSGSDAAEVSLLLPDYTGDELVSRINSQATAPLALAVMPPEIATDQDLAALDGNEILTRLNTQASGVLKIALLPVGTTGDHQHPEYLTEGRTDLVIGALAAILPTRWVASAAVPETTVPFQRAWHPTGIKTRLLKTSSTSLLKLTLTTNLGAGNSCAGWARAQLETRMDGGSINCYQTVQNYQAGANAQNHLWPVSTACVLGQVPAGYHEFEVWVEQVNQPASPPCGEASVGWSSTSQLIAEEIAAAPLVAFSAQGALTDVTTAAYARASGRSVSHTKQASASIVKITYADTMRAGSGAEGGSLWTEVRVDGASLAPPCQSFQSSNANTAQITSEDNFIPVVVTCIAQDLLAGAHTYEVYAKTAGSGSAQLGMLRSAPLLMVEEITPGPGISYRYATSATSNLSGNPGVWYVAPDRDVSHVVGGSAGALKITYSDTVRAGLGADGSGGSVAIKVDDAAVSEGCMATAYHWNDMASASQDHQLPVNLVCLIRDLAAGPHTFRLAYEIRSAGTMQLGYERPSSLMMIEELP
jgi:hypothetical protein